MAFKRYILLLLVLLPFKGISQRVLNGSFEDNTFPYAIASAAIGQAFPLYFKNVEYKTNTSQIPSGFIMKDTLAKWVQTIGPTLNVQHPIHGKTYIAIGAHDPTSYLIFKLSEPLTKGKLYSIRFDAGPFRNHYPRQKPVMLGLGKSNSFPEEIIDSVTILDTVGYRQYVRSFIATDVYTYVYLYKPRPESAIGTLVIDDVQLDTCVVLKPKRTIGCAGFPYQLATISTGNQFFWNTGDTLPIITISKEGSYACYSYDASGCVTIDSIEVGGQQETSTNNALVRCGVETLTLNSLLGASYLWSTGETNQQIVTSQADTLWVKRTKSSGCFAIDTFYIHREAQPDSNLLDTFYCTGKSIVLATSSAQTYQWSTGEQTQKIEVKASGTYTVTKNNQRCKGQDTFYVTEKSPPNITSLQDTTVCFDEVAQILLDAGHFKSYLWKPTGETTQTIYSTTAQIYLLAVTDSNNCSTSKQAAVMETCPDFIYIPTAFTPNNDGINDVFLPKTKSLESYELIIINRWGAILFTTKNPLQGWDGKEAPAEVYIAQIRYSTAGKGMKVVSKNITLLR